MRRKRHNFDLPPGLYCSKKKGRYYFRYRHPVTGKEHGLGTDKRAAVSAAIKLNNEFRATLGVGDLVRRVLVDGTTMGEWLDRYYTSLQERDLADTTLRSQRSLLKQVRERFGDTLINEVTTKQCAEFFNEVRASGRQRTAQALRSTMKELFRDAIAEGLITSNPAAVTRSQAVAIQRERLTLDTFKAILAASERLDPWVSNALLLALLSGQRVSDVAKMRFKDVSDGWLHVEQKKTGNRVRLSLGLRLDAVGLSLGDVVSRCRDTVLSPYLVHHTRKRTKSAPGDGVHENTVSKGFKRARDLTDLDWEKTPASFNEIRSLSGRLYKDQGVDPQALLGHKDAATTAVYLDGRNVEWISVNA